MLNNEGEVPISPNVKLIAFELWFRTMGNQQLKPRLPDQFMKENRKYFVENLSSHIIKLTLQPTVQKASKFEAPKQVFA